MQRDTNWTPRCHVIKWSIRKQRQRHWDHRNMEKRLEWQKHRCLRKDILTVALVGEHWKSVLMHLSLEGITLVLDDGLWRAPHTSWGLLPGVILWLLGKLQNTPSCCYRNKQFCQHGDARPEQEANRKKKPDPSLPILFSAHATDRGYQRAAGGAVMMPGPIHTAEDGRVGDSSCN